MQGLDVMEELYSVRAAAMNFLTELCLKRTKDMLKLVRAAAAGDYAEAQKMHFKLFTLCREMLGLSTNPIPIKGAMKMLGRDSGELRLPMTPLCENGEKRLAQVLTDYGLL